MSCWPCRLVCAALCLVVDAGRAGAEQDSVRASVVKIFTTQRGPDFYRPWTKRAPSEAGGTGFVIEEQRILTNAHVISYASQVYVQPYQSAEKLAARVIAHSNVIDLAILEVEDRTFFADHPPLPLDDRLPAVKSGVNVYGYPIGGKQMSVTEGIVSRVEYADYYLDEKGLRVQIDAALNPGNSGGPALSDGKVVGVAFSGIRNAENIGYLIPVEEVKLFLTDIDDGTCDGKPQLPINIQPVENDALRDWAALSRDAGGCLVTRVASLAPDYPLKPRDVITQIGPHRLDRAGNVHLGDNLQVLFTYHVPQLAANGKVPLTVLRGGKSMSVDAPVVLTRQHLVPYLYGRYPSYFIVGPVVFSTASRELIDDLLRRKGFPPGLVAAHSPLATRGAADQKFDGEELVIIPSPFFSHRLTKGYTTWGPRVVAEMNGVALKNLAHLVQLVRDSQDEFLEFKLAENDAVRLVFPRQEMLDATEEILSDNGIRNQCSPDIEAVWKQ